MVPPLAHLTWPSLGVHQLQACARADGFDDRSCTPGGSSNKVAIRHDDGTMAWYLHMKKWSVTPKGVGETVLAGEYLGVVGSSGSSSLPHLHFDVRDTGVTPAAWTKFQASRPGLTYETEAGLVGGFGP